MCIEVIGFVVNEGEFGTRFANNKIVSVFIVHSC